MGSECLQAAPRVGWGYWHDGADRNGDHRFDWSIAGDPPGMQMRRLVAAANAVRWDNLALRTDSLDVTHDDRNNGVLAFVRETDGNTVLVVVNLWAGRSAATGTASVPAAAAGDGHRCSAPRTRPTGDGTGRATRFTNPGPRATGRSISTSRPGPSS
jgi:1,4-alpha-glucan branching enzyme